MRKLWIALCAALLITVYRTPLFAQPLEVPQWRQDCTDNIKNFEASQSITVKQLRKNMIAASLPSALAWDTAWLKGATKVIVRSAGEGSSPPEKGGYAAFKEANDSFQKAMLAIIEGLQADIAMADYYISISKIFGESQREEMEDIGKEISTVKEDLEKLRKQTLKLSERLKPKDAISTAYERLETLAKAARPLLEDAIRLTLELTNTHISHGNFIARKYCLLRRLFRDEKQAQTELGPT